MKSVISSLVIRFNHVQSLQVVNVEESRIEPRTKISHGLYFIIVRDSVFLCFASLLPRAIKTARHTSYTYSPSRDKIGRTFNIDSESIAPNF